MLFMATRFILAAVFAVAAGAGASGCVTSDVITEHAYAPDATFHADIVECAAHADCEPLCVDVFELGPDAVILQCKILERDTGGARVRVRFTGANGGWDDGSVWDDGGWIADGGSYDDSGDDGGSCDDGSCDDGGSSDDGGGDDGSCNDGSCDPGGDGGGDDGGGDDGDGGGGDGGGGDDGGGDDGLRIHHGHLGHGTTPDAVHPATRAR